MLADQQIVTPHSVSRVPATSPRRRRCSDLPQGRLRRIDRAGRQRAAAQVGGRTHAVVAAHDEVRRAIAVGIAHRDRTAASAGARLRVDPRQRRVPGDIDVAADKGGHLQFVIRVVDAVDRAALGREERPDDVPDDRDLRIVDDGADEYRFHRASVMKRTQREQRTQRRRGERRRKG